MGPSGLVAGLNNYNYLTSAAGEVVESSQLSARSNGKRNCRPLLSWVPAEGLTAIF